MWFCRRAVLAAAVAAFAFPALAEMKSPPKGTYIAWACTGPHATRYDVTVKEIKDNLILYVGSIDKATYWAWKSAKFTGTNLWLRKSGDQLQWFDEADIVGFAKLRPNSRFKIAIPAQTGEQKWVWDYEVFVRAPQQVQHELLGNVTLYPILEKRRIFHGTYWSEMLSLIDPARGITVEWRYTDPKGTEVCKLAEYSIKQAEK
jgi:hypothetical protein